MFDQIRMILALCWHDIRHTLVKFSQWNETDEFARVLGCIRFRPPKPSKVLRAIAPSTNTSKGELQGTTSRVEQSTLQSTEQFLKQVGTGVFLLARSGVLYWRRCPPVQIPKSRGYTDHHQCGRSSGIVHITDRDRMMCTVVNR